MDSSTTDHTTYGISDTQSGPGQRDDNHTPNPNPLVDHRAVIDYRTDGVTTDDLVSFIESFASLRAGRVKKIGHDQYSHAKGQKFESFSATDTVRELIEELADASNYIDFLAIKLLNIAATMESSELDCD